MNKKDIKGRCPLFFIAFTACSDEHTIWKLGFFRNRWLILSTFIAIALQLSVVYVPFIRIPFKMVPLNFSHWILIISVTGTIFILENIRKAIFPKLFSFGKWAPLGERINEIKEKKEARLAGKSL